MAWGIVIVVHVHNIMSCKCCVFCIPIQLPLALLWFLQYSIPLNSFSMFHNTRARSKIFNFPRDGTSILPRVSKIEDQGQIIDIAHRRSSVLHLEKLFAAAARLFLEWRYGGINRGTEANKDAPVHEKRSEDGRRPFAV